MEEDVIIRKYRDEDRPYVRRISCATAFLGAPTEYFIEDEEVLADLLTLYFTDYEKNSCFVAESRGKVVGYVIGTTDHTRMHRHMPQILARIVWKALSRGLFVKKQLLCFLYRVARSAVKGEFLMPDVKNYPAVLHINIEEGYRRRALGKRMLDIYCEFLKKSGVHGVHCCTLSEDAARFFVNNGFFLIIKKERSFMNVYFKRKMYYSIMGKSLDGHE